jgi:hypothetical protein
MKSVLSILFEAEGYTFLCQECYAAFSHLTSPADLFLHDEAFAYLDRHVLAGGGCQWCDTVLNLTADRLPVPIEGVRFIEALGPGDRWIECRLHWSGQLATLAGDVGDTVPLMITVERGCRRRVLHLLRERWPRRRIEVKAEASRKGTTT